MESDFPKSPRMFICGRRCSLDALVIPRPLIITGKTISSNLRKTWRLFLSSWMLLDSAGRHETSPCDIIAVYVRLIPQPTNGAAAFMTSQAVSRPAPTKHFLANSCPCSLILKWKLIHSYFFKIYLDFSQRPGKLPGDFEQPAGQIWESRGKKRIDRRIL